MSTNHSLIHLLSQVRNTAEAKGLVESTIVKKLFLLKLVLGSIKKFTGSELQQFFKEGQTHKKRPLSPHTKNSIKIELKWLYRHVLKRDIPPELEPLLKKEQVLPKGKKIKSEEFEELIDKAPSPLFALAYQLLYDSGIRPHELLSLTTETISFPKPGIALIQLPLKNPKTPSERNKTGARPIMVQGSSVERLKKHIKQISQGDNPSTLLFPWAHRTLSSVFCSMKQKYNESQQRTTSPSFTPNETNSLPQSKTFTGRLYDLRHTAATRLASRGLPDQLLRKTMGWTQASRMPNIYIHLDEKDLLQWYEQETSLTKSSVTTTEDPNANLLDISSSQSIFYKKHKQ